MTAVDRPDNGQDEGRCPTCCGRVWSVRHGKWVMRRETVGMVCQTCGTDYSLTSGRAGAGEQQREQAARWLFAHAGNTPRAWDRLLNDAGKRVWRDYADELLSLLGGPQPDGDA